MNDSVTEGLRASDMVGVAQANYYFFDLHHPRPQKDTWSRPPWIQWDVRGLRV